MNIEIAFRTYNSFGPNATLNLLSKWLASKLSESYGGKITSIMVEACCANTSPPKKTLERTHENFEGWLSELPYYEVIEKGSELRICYRAVRYSHDEVQRDSQVLALKTFQVMLRKAAQLVEFTPNLGNAVEGFDSLALSADLKKAEEVGPSNLGQLAELYLEFK